ncbi:MAG: hypothetical protein M3Y82_13460 [Verrucomicrobiota bacterium]|nr:hypothetical protein [Verrucomicrobiota bacterium]
MSTFHKIVVGMAIGSFTALILLSLIGKALDVQNPVHNREAAAMIVKVTAIGLLLVFAFSLLPLMLHLFVVLQGKIGNGELAPIRFLREHERGVTFAFWGVFTAGLLIALPVMWTDLFGFDKPLFGFAKPLPRKQGAIVANVGMTPAQAAARSSFKISPGIRESFTGSSMSISQGIFDFEVADDGIRFENCRYCAIQTGPHDNPDIVHINVGISTRKMPRDKFKAETESIRRRLLAAGWLAGHYEFTDPEKITLHGGTREGDGRYWAKDSALLILSEKRMDDKQPNENSATAGEFIHVLDVLPRNDPSYQKLIFEPQAAAAKSL